VNLSPFGKMRYALKWQICHMRNVTIMIKPFFEAVRAFKSGPFKSTDLVKRLGYASGYVRNFLSQATRQGLLVPESRAGKREKTFRANPRVVRDIVLRGGKDKEELLNAMGLRSKYFGEYVALDGFEIIDHDQDLYRLGERVFSNREAPGRIVVTNVGVPKKIITVEV